MSKQRSTAIVPRDQQPGREEQDMHAKSRITPPPVKPRGGIVGGHRAVMAFILRPMVTPAPHAPVARQSGTTGTGAGMRAGSAGANRGFGTTSRAGRLLVAGSVLAALIVIAAGAASAVTPPQDLRYACALTSNGLLRA